MDGYFDFIMFPLTKSTQQAIHEFIIAMFSFFAATKATEYTSLELTKINKNKATQIYHSFLLISLFCGNLLSSIGHFLILRSASNPQICEIQSKLLQFGPVLSMWSKASLLHTKYYQTNNNIVNLIMPILISTMTSLAVPSSSYGLVDENVPNWCWIKGATKFDNLCRFCAFYAQLLILTVFTFYTIFKKTQLLSFDIKSLKTVDFYSLPPEILFSVGLTICFILPSFTRFYQYLYPNDCIAWIITSLTAGCISFSPVVDAFIYRFYIKYKENTDKIQTKTTQTPSTVKCESIVVQTDHVIASETEDEQLSTDYDESNSNLRTITFIQKYAFYTTKYSIHFIPYDVCKIIADKLYRPKFISEFEKNQIETCYEYNNIDSILELDSLIRQLKAHNGYKELNDDELAALLFAVRYNVLDEYGPNTIKHGALLSCCKFCRLLRDGFEKVYEQKQHRQDIDVYTLFYQISNNYVQDPIFRIHSLWRENVDPIADKSHSTLIENNLGGQLTNGNIKCFRIDWKLKLDNLEYDNDDDEDDIFKIDATEVSDYNNIDYKSKNIWMLEPMKFNGRRDRIITHKIGFAQPF